MTHYHLRVGDAPRANRTLATGLKPGATPAQTRAAALPSVAPPKAAPAKAPKAPTARPPKPPATPKTPGARRPAVAKPSASSALQGISRGLRTGTSLARRGQNAVERLDELGESVNRDAEMDEMGHYHFNVPSRGASMQRDYGTSEGARKRSQHQVAAESHMGRARREQAVGYGPTRQSIAHTQAAKAHTQAHALMGKPGYQQAAAAAHAASRRAWGSGDSGFTVTKGGPQFDAGTSEGAKKAAQTRARGGTTDPQRLTGTIGQAAERAQARGHPRHSTSPYQSHSERTPYWRGGELDIKAGSQTRQAAPRREAEPFRGYDSRRK